MTYQQPKACCSAKSSGCGLSGSPAWQLQAIWWLSGGLLLASLVLFGLSFTIYRDSSDWYSIAVSAGKELDQSSHKLSRIVGILEEEGAGPGSRFGP